MALVDQKLFRELKTHYPEVPDDIVTSCMTRMGNDRGRCMENLSNESARYLFGLQNSQMPDPVPGLNEMTLGESRPRSDSSGSNMSNTSSSSASSRPPFTTSHSLINVPGYRGPIMPGDDGHPATAPIVSNDIKQFMDIYGNERTSQNIPNIDCNNSPRVHEGHQVVSYGANYDRHTGNSPPNQSQIVQLGLRPIEVKHIQTNKDQGESGNVPNMPSQSVTYVRLDPSGAGGVTAGSTQSQPVTPQRGGGWVRHPVSIKPYTNPAYHNVSFPNNPNNTYTSDPRTPVSQYNYVPSSAYKSPSEEHVGFGASQYNQNHYGTQHTAQATIYLQNPAAPNMQYNTQPRSNQYNNSSRTDRTMQHSPNPGQYSVQSSVNDMGAPQTYLRPAVQMPGVSNCQIQQGVSRGPIYVEIKGGVQSHIQHFNELGTGSSGGPGVGQSSIANTVIGQEGYAPNNPPAYGGRLFPPETRPTVINIQGANTSQDDFLQFPPMANVCRVPGHPHGSGPSVVSGHPHGAGPSGVPGHGAGTGVEPVAPVYGSDYRQVPTQQFVSPASSHSSLSSESSAAVTRERPRSGSIDDPEYTQALLTHQNSRMNKLVEDLSAAEGRVQQLKGEVTKLESRVIEKKRKRESVFPSSVDLARLKGDNLQLQAEIQLMTREIDRFNNGETPLGVLDPSEQQSFYRNLENTGPSGSIYGNAGALACSHAGAVAPVSTAPVSSMTVPTRPPSLHPPEIPPSLPPRDSRHKDVPPPLPPRSVVQTAAVPPVPPQQPAVNSGDSDADGEQWNCSACTFLNHPALNKCECCEMPRMTGGSSASTASPGDTPDTFPLTAAQSAQTT